jgi:asparagine synthase (glutamine-hydrolysing)
MCGIGGVFNWSDPAGFDATRTAADLCAALAHRGPDGEGTFIDRGALLVHRRLAIIDPTPAARQPMTTPDGRYTIVFNGEIYNYRDLRVDLGQGPAFASPPHRIRRCSSRSSCATESRR